jgi:hypothetical protein
VVGRYEGVGKGLGQIELGVGGIEGCGDMNRRDSGSWEEWEWNEGEVGEVSDMMDSGVVVLDEVLAEKIR